jgi:plastocyanin
MKRTIVIGLIAGIVLLLGAVLLLMTNANPPTDQGLNETVNEESPNDLTQNVTNETPQTTEITLTEQGFSPAEITVSIGTKVIWRNLAATAASVDSEPHPMHNAYPPLNLGLFQNGETLEFIFTESGTYQFHNHLNPDNKGTVVVE